MKKLLTFLALSTLLSTSAVAEDAAHSHGLMIADAWSRVTTPTAKVGGGYLTITNQGHHDDKLLAVASDHAERAEVHMMMMDDDVMIMRPVSDGLVIPAGETVQLAPSGYHLMFMQLNQPPIVGEPFTATLVFERAGEKIVAFDVLSMRDSMKRAAMSEGDDHGSEGHKH